jgi:hypothetical protein
MKKNSATPPKAGARVKPKLSGMSAQEAFAEGQKMIAEFRKALEKRK